MEFVVFLLFMIPLVILDLYLTCQIEKDYKKIQKKYNDLRVENARLKSKVGK